MFCLPLSSLPLLSSPLLAHPPTHIATLLRITWLSFYWAQKRYDITLNVAAFTRLPAWHNSGDAVTGALDQSAHMI